MTTSLESLVEHFDAAESDGRIYLQDRFRYGDSNRFQHQLSRSGYQILATKIRVLYHDDVAANLLRIRFYFMTGSETAVMEYFRQKDTDGYRWIREPDELSLIALLLKM